MSNHHKCHPMDPVWYRSEQKNRSRIECNLKKINRPRRYMMTGATCLLQRPLLFSSFQYMSQK